jgi:hypothetical protein
MNEEKDLAVRWRHEYKYRIDAGMAAQIRGRIAGLLEPDAHAGAEGFYEIRSVYFDDHFDTCYRQNRDGTDPRHKFRIRCYNGSRAFVRLEKKSKNAGMTAKESCVLSADEAQALIAGSLQDIDAQALTAKNAVFREFWYLQRTKNLRPKVMVVYDRFPYLYPAGNVRVTLDCHISSGPHPEELFAPHPLLKPVLESGRGLLEVKYDGLLPRAVKQSLQLSGLSQETFSKYYLCRREEKKYYEYL